MILTAIATATSLLLYFEYIDHRGHQETKSLSVISGKNYVFLKMNGIFFCFLVAALKYEGLAILPRTECIEYVNADRKKDADMTLQKGCIREGSNSRR